MTMSSTERRSSTSQVYQNIDLDDSAPQALYQNEEQSPEQHLYETMEEIQMVQAPNQRKTERTDTMDYLTVQTPMTVRVSNSSRTTIRQTWLTVSSSVVFVISLCLLVTLLVYSSVRAPMGTVTLTVHRMDFNTTNQPWKVLVGVERRTNFFLYYISNNFPKRVQFKNVREDQTVYLSVRSFRQDLHECDYDFTVTDIIASGRLNISYPYQTLNCTITMTVFWNPIN